MKKFYVLFLLLAAIGCTNNNSSTQSPGEQSEEGSVVFDISNLEVDGFFVSPDPIALGNTSGEEKSATIIVKNSNSSSQSITVGQLTQAGFKIKINRCSSAIAAGKSCQITVAFSPRDLFTGSYNDSLVINTGSIPITASVSGRPDPDTTGTPDLKLSLSAPFEPIGPSPLRSLIIKNEGTGTALNIAIAIPSAYTVWTNRCSSNLKPGKSCEVQVVLKNARQLPPVADQSVIVSSSSQVDPVSLNLKEGTTSVQDSYVATYATTHVLSVCDGTQNYTENLIACVNSNDGSTDMAQCASTSSIQYQSPAGTKDISVANGTRHDTCELGSSTVSSFTLDCNVNTYKTASSLLCINPTMAVDGTMTSILFDEENNRIYLAGAFTHYNSELLSGTINLIKVDATTGARDTNFNVTFAGGAPAHAAVVLDSTKTNLYLGGTFTQVNGTSRARLAKINSSTGVLDSGFDASSEVNTWGGKSVYGINEYGSDIYVNGAISGTGVLGVAKFDSSTGAVNSTFKTNSAAAIVQTTRTAYSLKINSGLLYVSGSYTTAGGAPRNGVFSLNSDGTLNSSFDAGLTAGEIYASGIKDGYLYVAHSGKLKKLSLTTGVEDTSFAMPVVTGTPVIQGFSFYGTSIYVGGMFNAVDGVTTKIAKIALSNGAVDTGFVIASVPGSIKTYFVTGDLFLIGGDSSPYLRGHNTTTGTTIW